MGRGSACAGGRRRAARPRLHGGAGIASTCYSPAVDAQSLTINGVVPAVGFGLAGLGTRTMPHLAEGRAAD